jgi:hypothetical protein
MSAWNYSLVFIVSDSNKADSNKLATAFDHCPPGADEYTVPLRLVGSTSVSHWLCHSFCIQQFAEMLVGVSQGVLPAPEAGGTYEDYDLTEARVWELMSSAIVSCIKGADPQAHVADILAANNLERC